MMLEALAVGVVVGAPLGYVGRAWWKSRQKARRLSAVYARYQSEPTTVVVPAMEPPRRVRTTAWVAWQKRHPVRMNLPAVRPIEDEDDALWSRRSSELSLSPDPRGFDPALTLPLGTDDAPAFEGRGGAFGGAGASGGWDTLEPAASDGSTFDAPSGGDSGGSDP